VREHAQPPEGSSLTLVRFEIVELFEVEGRRRLERSLLALFPDATGDGLPERTPRGVIRDLRSEVQSTKRFGSASLGMIASPEEYTSLFHQGQDSSLSPNFIGVRVHHVRLLPSLYALSFSFQVSERANANLSWAQAQKECLPNFRFHSISLKGLSAWSEQGSETPEAAKLGELRQEAKLWVARYARGVLQSAARGSDGLAAVDVFRIAGVPDGDPARLEWISKSRAWLLGFHLEVWRDALHDGDSAALLLDRFGPLLDRFGRRLPPALLFYREDDKTGSQERVSRRFAMTWSLSRYLASIESGLGSTREDVFRRLRRARWRFRDGRTISRLDELLFLIRRLKVEASPPRQLNRILADVPDFNGNESYWTGGSFKESFREYVQREVESIETYLGLLRGALSDQVAVRNLFRMYWLQWTVLLVAVVNVLLITETGQQWMKRLEAWLRALMA
jgi:hypothetical protein